MSELQHICDENIITTIPLDEYHDRRVRARLAPSVLVVPVWCVSNGDGVILECYLYWYLDQLAGRQIDILPVISRSSPAGPCQSFEQEPSEWSAAHQHKPAYLQCVTFNSGQFHKLGKNKNQRVQLQNIDIILIMAPRLVAGLPLSQRKQYLFKLCTDVYNYAIAEKWNAWESDIFWELQIPSVWNRKNAKIKGHPKNKLQNGLTLLDFWTLKLKMCFVVKFTRNTGKTTKCYKYTITWKWTNIT